MDKMEWIKMKKIYIVTTHTEREYEAESEDEAREMFWEDIEGEPQQTLATFFEDNTIVELKE